MKKSEYKAIINQQAQTIANQDKELQQHKKAIKETQKFIKNMMPNAK